VGKYAKGLIIRVGRFIFLKNGYHITKYSENLLRNPIKSCIMEKSLKGVFS
jgi:hypothetical protein